MYQVPRIEACCETTQNSNRLSKIDHEQLTKLFDSMIEGKLEIDSKEIKDSPAFNKLQEIQELNISSQRTSQTGRLWLQYMEMVTILRQFIKSERTGNWTLHLQSMMDMLPFFAACGHNNYLKSGYLYLQKMIPLEQTNPNVYHLFMSGLHVIRRSKRYWGALSADLVIEEVFMRSMKTSGW